MEDTLLKQMDSTDLQMLELVCRSAHLGGWRLDRRADTITLSSGFSRLLKFPIIEEKTFPCDVFSREYIYPEDNWFVRDYIYAPPVHNFLFRVFCEDGSTRWLESFPASEFDEDDTIVYGVVQDVTERVVGESDLQNARKMESIRSIAGGIAHEFNNILYSISGYIGLSKDLLSEGDAMNVAELTEFINEIDYSNKRAVHLIKKIQTFSHVGKKGIVTVLLNDAVTKVLGRVTCPENVRIQQTPQSTEQVYVYADEATLFESLSNIFDNGIQAMVSSGGMLHVDVDRVFEQESRSATCGTIKTGYYGRVSVRDEGCGMDSNTVSRIFEPFFTTRQTGKGTGMGLAIVYGMVNVIGGAAEVSSESGKGTIFRLYLPACSAVPRE